MSSLEDKIRQLGQASDQEELQGYLSGVDFQEVSVTELQNFALLIVK